MNSKIIEVKEKQIENIESWKPKQTKIRDKIIERQTKAKTFGGWLIATETLLRNDKRLEESIFVKVIHEKYDFYMERDKVILEMWKGKSGLEIIEKPDCFVIIRYQKKEKDGEPLKIVKEIEKTEVNEIIHSINRLWNKAEEKDKGISTRDISEMTYQKDWDKEIFSDRELHHKITYILNILEYYGFTRYSRAGLTFVLMEAETIQEVMNKK